MSVSRVSAFALSKQTHLFQLITGLLSGHEVEEHMPQAHGGLSDVNPETAGGAFAVLQVWPLLA